MFCKSDLVESVFFTSRFRRADFTMNLINCNLILSPFDFQNTERSRFKKKSPSTRRRSVRREMEARAVGQISAALPLVRARERSAEDPKDP